MDITSCDCEIEKNSFEYDLVRYNPDVTVRDRDGRWSVEKSITLNGKAGEASVGGW